MFGKVNGVKVLLNGAKLLPRAYSLVDMQEGCQPQWISTSAIVYASGCNLLFYDFISSQQTLFAMPPD